MSNSIKGYYLSNENLYSERKEKTISNELGEVTFSLPIISKKELELILSKLREARKDLAKLKINERVDILKSTFRLWMNEDYEKRRLAEELLPITLNYSPQMIHTMFDKTFSRLNDDVSKLSLTNNPPELVVVSYPDIPGPQMLTVAAALYNGASTFCVGPENEPILTGLFLDSISEISPIMGNNIAGIPFDSGDLREFSKTLYGNLTRKDSIIHFGSSETYHSIELLKNQDTSINGYTKGIGISVIGREYLSTEKVRDTLHTCAINASMYNRNACFSPQAFIVEEGGCISPHEFAESLAEIMEILANGSLPVGNFVRDDYARFVQVHRSNQLQKLQGLLDYFPIIETEEKRPIGGVVYSKSEEFFLPRTGNRIVNVIPISSLEDLVEMINPVIDSIHTLGLGVDGRFDAISGFFTNTNIRISNIQELLNLSFNDYRLF